MYLIFVYEPINQSIIKIRGKVKKYELIKQAKTCKNINYFFRMFTAFNVASNIGFTETSSPTAFFIQ